MPYAVRRKGPRNYEVVKKTTGQVVSHHDSRTKARAAIRAIESHIHGK